LQIEHPIVLGGMTGVGTVELAAAVSNAGGLGIFAAHNAGSPEECRRWIRTIRTLLKPKKQPSSSSSSSTSGSQDGDKSNPTATPGSAQGTSAATDTVPFGVNITILPTIGAPPPYLEYVEVCIEEGVPVVETAGNNPAEYVALLKRHGIVTIHKCVTIRHALAAEKMGVDVVSLDGMECAGHPGEGDVGNFVLQAVGAQRLSVPFLCSGGVGNGQQLAAALALGADGVNCGTLFCATQECNWPDPFKQRMVDGTELDTVLMFRRLRNTTRVFANAVAKQVERIESDAGRDFTFQHVRHLVSGSRGREAERNRDPDGGIWSAGQVIGLIRDIPTVADLVRRMVQECADTIQTRLDGMVMTVAEQPGSEAAAAAPAAARPSTVISKL
jgi:NADH:quinone reductase (non-electrogenic)